MKLKVKDEMDKIKANLTHQELVLIEEALYELRNSFIKNEKSYTGLNNKVFDRDEFYSNNEVIFKLTKMISNIEKVTDKINVW